jgi:hypothetical protein
VSALVEVRAEQAREATVALVGDEHRGAIAVGELDGARFPGFGRTSSRLGVCGLEGGRCFGECAQADVTVRVDLVASQAADGDRLEHARSVATVLRL